MSNLQVAVIMLFTGLCVAVAYIIGYTFGRGVSTTNLVIPEAAPTGMGTYTPYLHLYIPQEGEGHWTIPFNDNLRRIDEFAATGKVSPPVSYVPLEPEKSALIPGTSG